MRSYQDAAAFDDASCKILQFIDLESNVGSLTSLYHASPYRIQEL